VLRGVVQDEGLKQADLSEVMLLSLARINGVESLDEVKTSYLEINGQVSVVPWGPTGRETKGG
jgi:uncharacterized membrane protein YcaP (DUF421 family)